MQFFLRKLFTFLFTVKIISVGFDKMQKQEREREKERERENSPKYALKDDVQKMLLSTETFK